MNNQRFWFMTRLGCWLAVIGWLLVMANTSLAQSGGRPAPPPGGPNMKEEMQRQEMRETMLRHPNLGGELEKRDQKRIDAAIAQVQQDFKQLQVVRNEVVRNLIAKKPLDYKLITDEAAEINKRADRLKTYLIPPMPKNSKDAKDKEKGQKDQGELTNDQMKSALVQLCNRIALFIENPVLKTPGTIDVAQSTRVSGELQTIIELSSNIKRSAERLNNPSQ
jgi:hypothetical protein